MARITDRIIPLILIIMFAFPSATAVKSTCVLYVARMSVSTPRFEPSFPHLLFSASFSRALSLWSFERESTSFSDLANGHRTSNGWLSLRYGALMKVIKEMTTDVYSSITRKSARSPMPTETRLWMSTSKVSCFFRTSPDRFLMYTVPVNTTESFAASDSNWSRFS